MKKLLLASTVLAICSFSFAENSTAANINNQSEAAATAQQKAAQAAPHSPSSTADCSFTFTSGTKQSFLKYCVTANGNVTLFQTPAGHEHIAVGVGGEGYGICDLHSNVAYDDYAEYGDSGNWGPASVVGQTANSVKIARTTSDGVWTLTQTFNQITGSQPAAKITMSLQNNTGVSRNALLMRYADVDADSVFLNSLDGTAHTSFGFQPAINGITFGLSMQDMNSSPFHEGYSQSVPQGPAPCTPFASFPQGTLTETDGSIVMIYSFAVPKNASKSVTVSYKGL